LFGPTNAKEWNINASNTLPKQNILYSAIHTSFSVSGNNFDSTVTAKQEDFFSKYFKDFTIDNFDTLNVLKGKELYYNCISFGME